MKMFLKLSMDVKDVDFLLKTVISLLQISDKMLSVEF